MTTQCDDEALQAYVEDSQAGRIDGTTRIDELLMRFPDDARLHFLRGSMLIGEGRYVEGHDGLARAVALAPDFAIARFQLGLFELTSGEADKALDTWGRLDRLPDDHYLRQFVDGLRCLIRDDFLGATVHLRGGMVLNSENPPLNHDMQLIVDRCDSIMAGDQGVGDSAISETSLILQRFTKN